MLPVLPHGRSDRITLLEVGGPIGRCGPTPTGNTASGGTFVRKRTNQGPGSIGQMSKRAPDTVNSDQTGVTELAFRELWRVIGKLKRIAEPHFARFGISPAQWGILRCIQRRELDGSEPPRVTDLCDNLLVKPPSVSALVDRLERMKLVARAPTGDDQRSRRVCLTETGRRLVEQVLVGHGDWIRMLMAGLTIEEQTELLRMLNELGAHLEPLVQRTGAGADDPVVEGKSRRSRR